MLVLRHHGSLFLAVSHSARRPPVILGTRLVGEGGCRCRTSDVRAALPSCCHPRLKGRPEIFPRRNNLSVGWDSRSNDELCKTVWPALGSRIKRRAHQGTRARTRLMLRRDRESIRQRALTWRLDGFVHRACLRQTSARPRRQERWSFCAPHVAKSTCNNGMERWRAVTSGDLTNQQQRCLEKSSFPLGNMPVPGLEQHLNWTEWGSRWGRRALVRRRRDLLQRRWMHLPEIAI